MNTVEFTLLVALGSVLAGLVGVLTGLGGGVVIVPLLTLVFGVDIRYAIGASLVSVIATSSSAAATYIKEGYSNLRVGMFLEIATTIGALVGAFLALIIAPRLIAVIFGLALLHSATTSWRDQQESVEDRPDPWAQKLHMDSSYPASGGHKSYHVQNLPGGFLLMLVAGALSGLLGIGSGALKVIAMDRMMKIPFKVSTTTSNFMIGVTAAASAGIYLNRGYIDPGLAMPVMLGVLLGATTGTHFLMRSRTKSLRILFSIVILVLAVEMIFNGIKGRL
jgi:uncharacterized protein